MVQFARGTEAAREQAKASSGGSGGFLSYFKLEAGSKQLIRFVHPLDGPEGAITVLQHSSVPTKPQPPDYPSDRKWPQYMGAVSRLDPAFTGMYEGDYILARVPGREGKPRRATPRWWALAVLREEVFNDQGQLLGVKTVTEKFTAKRDGVEVEIEQPKIVKVNQAITNFMEPLAATCELVGSNGMDRDFWVMRTGSEPRDTSYTFSAYPHVLDIDMSNWDIPDLGEIVADQATDEYYRLWFCPDGWNADGREEPGLVNSYAAVTGATSGESGGAAPQPVAPAGEASQADMAAIMERVSGGGSPAPSAPSAASTGAPALQNLD